MCCFNKQLDSSNHQLLNSPFGNVSVAFETQELILWMHWQARAGVKMEQPKISSYTWLMFSNISYWCGPVILIMRKYVSIMPRSVAFCCKIRVVNSWSETNTSMDFWTNAQAENRKSHHSLPRVHQGLFISKWAVRTTSCIASQPLASSIDTKLLSPIFGHVERIFMIKFGWRRGCPITPVKVR